MGASFPFFSGCGGDSYISPHSHLRYILLITCGWNHSTWTACIMKFCFFGKNPSGPFIHITWYHLNCQKHQRGALPGAFSFLSFFPKNLQFYEIAPKSLIFWPTIKCYTILESSCHTRRRAILVIDLVASTNEKQASQNWTF